MTIRKYALTIILLLLSTGVAAQTPVATTQGRDFWLTFMVQISATTGERSLMLSGMEGTTVHVNASSGWRDTLVIGSTGVVTCDVPDTHGLVFHVTADNDISVYASNYYQYSYDIATVYPTQSLGCNYMVQTYDMYNSPYMYGPEFSVVAVEDDTRVLVVPKAGTQQTVWLNAGEAAYFYWDDLFFTGDLMDGRMTGTHVLSSPDKPIAVFQGSMCANVFHSACDHLFEQAVPLEYWGRQFLVVPIAIRMADDVVRILSGSYNCRVSINDTITFVLQYGEYFDTIIHSAFSVGASGPVSLCMYMSGDTLEGSNNYTYVGDPSAILIPPVNQGVKSSSFAAVNTDISRWHYANVVTQTCHVGSVTLDGVPVDSAFTAFDDRWSYAQLKVRPGVHTLASSDGTLNAWFYGMGSAESYGYIAGMTLVDHSARLLIDGTEVNTTVRRCVGDTAHIELKTDSTVTETLWTLNGTLLPRTGLELYLPLDSVGTYTLQAMLPGDCCRQWCDSLQITLLVNPSYALAEEDSICEGVPYEWHGMTLTEAGDYVDSLRTRAGCDSLTTISLAARPFPQPGIGVEADCHSHTYRLEAIQHDTLHWTAMRWSIAADGTPLGNEGDSVIYLSPSSAMFVTLHAVAVCSADTTVLLHPIVYPTAQLQVRPQTVVASYNAAFDAYDMSIDATGREWTVDGMPQGDVGPQLHYPVSGAEDSIVVQLTAINDYCRDTAQAVVWVINEGVYAPNVFTPGQDINNRFSVIASNEIRGELTIYNREGLLLFRTTDLETGWGGGDCPQGAYVWHLHYRYAHSPEQWHTAMGTVTLLR